MLLLFSESQNPARNLAIEQYLVETKKYPSPIVFLWQNQNTIVVGRNQNLANEINWKAVEVDHVKVVRRNTGGGTVFQDLGNLCFSLIIDQQQNLTSDEVFQVCLTPVLKLLKKLGLKANFKGRNDLEIEGMKISGNAQLQTPSKILSHGTLLFDVDLSKIQQYLVPNKLKMASKKIASIPARVTNIRPLLKNNWTMSDFKKAVGEAYTKNQTTTKTLVLDQQDWNEIERVTKTKYENWEWNYGKNETFAFTHQLYFPKVGLIEVNLTTEEGKIQKIKFYGDFLGTKGTINLEQAMLGLNYDWLTMNKFFFEFSLKPVFGEEITPGMLTELLF